MQGRNAKTDDADDQQIPEIGKFRTIAPNAMFALAVMASTNLLGQMLMGEQAIPMISTCLKSRNSALSRRTAFALAVLASTAWTPVARATEFPAVIPLSSLNGSNGFRLDGEGNRPFSGWSVAGAGDVNGDGFADVTIGTFRAGGYVVFGNAQGDARAGENIGGPDFW